MKKWTGWDVLKGRVGSLVYGMFNEKEEGVGMYLTRKLGASYMECSMRRYKVWDVLDEKVGSLVYIMFTEKNERFGMYLMEAK